MSDTNGKTAIVTGASRGIGCEIVNGVADRVRAEMFHRIGLEDLLSPRVIG